MVFTAALNIQMQWKTHLCIYNRAETLSAAKQQRAAVFKLANIFTTISVGTGSGAQHEYSKQFHMHRQHRSRALSTRRGVSMIYAQVLLSFESERARGYLDSHNLRSPGETQFTSARGVQHH
jgi:hypothetical protein